MECSRCAFPLLALKKWNVAAKSWLHGICRVVIWWSFVCLRWLRVRRRRGLPQKLSKGTRASLSVHHLQESHLPYSTTLLHFSYKIRVSLCVSPARQPLALVPPCSCSSNETRVFKCASRAGGPLALIPPHVRASFFIWNTWVVECASPVRKSPALFSPRTHASYETRASLGLHHLRESHLPIFAHVCGLWLLLFPWHLFRDTRQHTQAIDARAIKAAALYLVASHLHTSYYFPLTYLIFFAGAEMTIYVCVCVLQEFHLRRCIPMSSNSGTCSPLHSYALFGTLHSFAGLVDLCTHL